MKIEWEGRTWSFDVERITLRQAMAIQLHTGQSIAAWEKSLDIGDDAEPGPEWLTGLQCVYWLMKNQNGEVFPVAEADFEIAGFLTAMAAGMQAELDARKTAEAVQAAEPDPTVPSRDGPDPWSMPVSPVTTTPMPRERKENDPGTVPGPAGT